MQKALLPGLLLLVGFASQAQVPAPQLRLKTGLSALFPSSGGRGYAFRTAEKISGSVVLGGEYSQPFRNGKRAWHAGFTFQDSYLNISPNTKNLLPYNQNASTTNSFYFSGSPAKTVVYGGLETYLNRNPSKPAKNYFSVVAGAGLAFTLNKFTNDSWSVPVAYKTHTGGTVEGYRARVIAPKFFLAPVAYAGLRYNVCNRKGREVLIAELLFNYGFSPYYKVAVDYKLDGSAKTDILKEKGACLQLNLMVPLYSFTR